MPSQQEMQKFMALREAKKRGMLGPTQSAAVGELEKRFSDYFKTVAEPAMTATSAMLAEPVSGLVGLAALPFGSDVSTRAIEKTQNVMTYQPRSEAGQQGLQGLMSVLGPVGEAIEGASSYLGDNVYEATGSPAAGAAAYSVPAMGLELLGLKGTRAASNAGKLGKQLEMGDIGRGSVGANQRGIFAGVKAKTANLDALEQAQDMANKGASRDEIWNETGWFKDVDGGWKFEIDDSGARTRDIFKADPMAREILEESDEVSTDLPYAMSHERFKSAYPDEFADTEVISKPYAQSEGGRYSMGTIKTPTDFRYGDDSFKINKSTTLHEMQHSVQEAEGFARGGMPDSARGALNQYERTLKEPVVSEKFEFDSLSRKVDDLRSAEYAAKLQKIIESENIKPSTVTNLSGFYQYSDEIRSKFGAMPKQPGAYRDGWLKSAAAYIRKQNFEDGSPASRATPDDMKEIKSQIRKWERRRDKYAKSSREYHDADRKIKDLKEKTDYELYQRLAGEAEARNVQARMNMTPDERRAKPPWQTLDVPEDELIIRRR